MERSLGVLTVGLALVFSASTGAAGFDCSKAKAPIEQMICQDSELGRLDYEMTTAFKAALSQAGSKANDLLGQQRHWLKWRREECKVGAEQDIGDEAKRQCARQATAARIASLKAGGSVAPQEAEQTRSTTLPEVCRFAANELQAGRRIQLEKTTTETGQNAGDAADANKLIAKGVEQRIDDDGMTIDTSYVTLDGGKSRLLLVRATRGTSRCERRYAYKAPKTGQPASSFLWADGDVACSRELGFFTYGKKTYAHESWRAVNSVEESGMTTLCSLKTSYEFKGAEIRRQGCTANVCADLASRIGDKGINPRSLLDAAPIPTPPWSEPDWSVDVDNDGVPEKVIFVSVGRPYGVNEEIGDLDPDFFHLVNGKWTKYAPRGFPPNGINATFIKSGEKVYTVVVNQEGDIDTKVFTLDVFLVENGGHSSLGRLVVKPHPVVQPAGPYE